MQTLMYYYYYSANNPSGGRRFYLFFPVHVGLVFMAMFVCVLEFLFCCWIAFSCFKPYPLFSYMSNYRPGPISNIDVLECHCSYEEY